MKKLTAVCLLFSLLFCCACGDAGVKAKQTKPPATTLQTEPPTTQPPQDVMTEGITVYDEGSQENATGDVQLRASLAADARLNGQYLLWLSLYQLDETHLIAVYSLSEKKPQPDMQADPPLTVQYAASYDLQTGAVINTLEFAPEAYVGENYTYGYFSQSGPLLWYIRSGEEQTTYTAYNAALEEEYTFTPQAANGTFSPDGLTYFTVRDFSVYAQRTDGSGQAEALALNPQLCVTQLEGAFYGENGAPCLLVTGYAADLQKYHAIADAQTGTVNALLLAGDLTAYCQNGMMLQTDYDTGTFLAVGEGSCRFGGQDGTLPSFEVLSGNRILFTETVNGMNETWITLSLADGGTGESLGTTSFTVPSATAMPYSFCVSDDAIVLLVSGADGADGQGVYRWDYPTSGKGENKITATPEPLPTWLPELEPLYDPSLLLPQPVRAELSDLRERADALQTQYGIELFISEECAGVFGGYAVIPATDRDTLESALDTLEAELTKYPDGFFRQFTESEISIYLAGELKGVEEGNLDYAGGFQTDWKGRAAIVIDCRYTDSVIGTLHHKISHAIDGHLLMNNAATDDTRWNAMNPSADCYTYDYGVFGTEETWQYTYWQAGPADAYFFDDYSLTYEKEDRARLFEHLMSDGQIDWENAPHLLEKVNYFAECIREGFDTTGWEAVYWERYLND